MTYPTIRDPLLDICLGEQVHVDFLGPAGVRYYFGNLQDYSKPWYLNLMFEFRTDGGLTAPELTLAERKW